MSLDPRLTMKSKSGNPQTGNTISSGKNGQSFRKRSCKRLSLSLRKQVTKEQYSPQVQVCSSIVRTAAEFSNVIVRQLLSGCRVRSVALHGAHAEHG